MALITRVARLFRADFNAVLDRIEEPDVLLRQAVREMQEDLARGEHSLQVMEHEYAHKSLRQKELLRTQADLGEELDVCFAADKDELARPLIKRKIESERMLSVLMRQLESLRTRITNASERLKQNRARFESMRQKADLLSEREHDTNPSDDWPIPDIAVRDEDIEVALLREKQRRAPS